uniref:Uncharacterized protein n=1 Tax=Noctiluca scintillans TaxID=2966 RepID=A0A7S1A5F2_NOCSC|mmetsp:Transcript_32525/g.87324  ORF Transcript_32525/g.87324 Transcript_32525/m.87324 type:complete len:122 (+) Transcript_32525:201-566(+)
MVRSSLSTTAAASKLNDSVVEQRPGVEYSESCPLGYFVCPGVPLSCNELSASDYDSEVERTFGEPSQYEKFMFQMMHLQSCLRAYDARTSLVTGFLAWSPPIGKRLADDVSSHIAWGELAP